MVSELNKSPIKSLPNTLLIALHEVQQTIRVQFGLEVTFNISINWNSTLHLASVVLHDMIGNQKKEWLYEHIEIPNNFGKGSLHCFEAVGKEVNKGLTITIYKQTDQRKHSHTPSRTSTKRYGPVAMAIHQIHTVLFELYGLTATIKIEGEVSCTNEGNKNDHPEITEERVIEILSAVRTGTKWTEQIEEVWFSPTHGRKQFKLLGPNMEFKVSYLLDKKS